MVTYTSDSADYVTGADILAGTDMDDLGANEAVVTGLDLATLEQRYSVDVTAQFIGLRITGSALAANGVTDFQFASLSWNIRERDDETLLEVRYGPNRGSADTDGYST